jgi:glycosyltransferase involved in cell wall biosynthesis
MHVLLLNQYYPPDTAATAKMAALIAETLAARHHVTVLAGRPSYDPSDYHPYYLLRRELCGAVTIERVGSTAYPRFRMRQRVSNYVSYLALAVPRALVARADVILAMTDPPVAGIAGALVASLRGKPFVYNIRDLYPDMALGGGIIRAGWFARLWERWHRWALRRAARVIVLGEDMRERIIAKGVAPERVILVRDGAPIPEMLPAPGHPVTEQIRCGFPFVLLHAGNLGFYGAWETLLAAAQKLHAASRGQIGLVFVGEGAARLRLEAAAAKNGASVRFLPFRPADEVPYVLAAADLHVISVRRGLEGVVVPSKMYPILAAGRPILAVAPDESDVVRIVRRVGCGVTADPDDPDSVVRAVQDVYQDKTRLAEMGRRAREAAREYDRVNQLQKFVETVESLAANR